MLTGFNLCHNLSCSVTGTVVSATTKGVPNGAYPGDFLIVSCSTAGGVLYENGTANTATCGFNLTWTASQDQLTVVQDIGAAETAGATLSQINTVSGVPTDVNYVGLFSDVEPSPAITITNEQLALAGQINAAGNGGGEFVTETGVAGSAQSCANIACTATVGTAIGVRGGLEMGATGHIITEADDFKAVAPVYTTGSTAPTLTNGLLVGDMDAGLGLWASDGIHVLSQTSPGKGIVVDGGGIYGNALFCGVLNTTSCVLTGYGSTSGTATLTWPAVAGTITNPIAFTNNVNTPGMTIAPTTNNVVGLVVKGTSGTGTPYVVNFTQAGGTTLFNLDPFGDANVAGQMAANAYYSSLALLISNTPPSIVAAGCGGSGASIISQLNATAAFKVGVGTGNTGTCTITMPAAATDWICSATDITTTSTTVSQTKSVPTAGHLTTEITLQNYTDISGTHAWVDNDVIAVSCMGE